MNVTIFDFGCAKPQRGDGKSEKEEARGRKRNEEVEGSLARADAWTDRPGYQRGFELIKRKRSAHSDLNGEWVGCTFH